MNKYFKEALEAGHLCPVVLPNGQNLELPDTEGRTVKYYFAGEDHVYLYGQRFMAITDLARLHNELRINPEYTQAHNAAVEDLLTAALMLVQTDPKKATQAIADVRTLHARFTERSRLSLDLEQFYDLVAATLFTEDEDPRTWELSQNVRKKQHVMRFPELYDFFLQQPLSRFIPWPVLFDPATRNLAKDRSILEAYDWALLQHKYSGSGLEAATLSTIASRGATLNAWTGLLINQSNPIAST
ncbi:hypothetical protein [Spirosoma sordidisoli]|uniref:Uncharacterized protein n=1 Tax=Spirosoma sordidisoli TaxID=2502893 RepID=A0A4V1RVD2_9BACT|nr:hypothetical protein [Spirosoma sordidisoli]RYC66358.1 hypothetical protein EQG79_30255 [Spirosoma sordidisoli]